MIHITVAEYADRLSNHKRLATGSRCVPFPATAVSDPGVTFEQVITEIYKWYHEELRDDRRHLEAAARRDQRNRLETFAQTVTDQRHAAQHTNYQHQERADLWRSRAARGIGDGHPSGDATIVAILTELSDTLEVLCDLATEIGRDSSRRRIWREAASSDPRQEILTVFQNIGMRPRPAQLSYCVRQYESHPGRTGALTREKRISLAEAVVIGASVQPLELNYEELLDEFALIGNSAGHALLLLAHSVSALGVSGPRLRAIVTEAWTIVTRG